MRKGYAMNIKHIIFDVDGTIIDTEKAVLMAWQATLNEYGYDFLLDDVSAVLGVTTDVSLARLNVRVDDKFLYKWSDNYSVFADDTDYFEKMEDLLKELKDCGFNLGIVTSRNRDEFKKFFSRFNFEKYFETRVLEEDTVKHKPDPEPLLKYMEMTGAKKEECIYIGDMESDILSAENAGITAALVRWNNSRLDYDKATIKFYDVFDVLDFVKNS